MFNPFSDKRTLHTLNVVLIIAILVAVNLVATNAFFKLDLTRNDAYSLSRVSRETLARLEDPLRVKVFYATELPAPYNGVRQYLTDILREFDSVEGQYFSWESIDVTTDAGRAEAQQYGLQQVEIQEIRSDEFQSRAVYMGAVVLYGNVVERVDRIASTDGLEYRLTTAISSAVTQVDALSGTTETVTMEVFASPSLADLQIQGFAELEAQMAAIHERVNADNYGRLDFSFRQPAEISEIRGLSEELGVRPIRWETQRGETREGLLEVVLRQGDRIERVPFEIYSQLFGGYTLDDPANIEEAVRNGLRSLVAANPQVAYAIGHGEKALQDFQRGAGPFAQLVGERYELLPVPLAEEGVPPGIDTLVINGPTERYSETALYRIDQFLMDGGSLLVLVDSYEQIVPTRQQQMQGAQPTWEPVETGLEALLQRYGVEITDALVLDEESYIARGQQGSQQLFQAPVLSGESISTENAVTAGLQDIIVLNTAELLPARDAAEAAEGGETDGDAEETDGNAIENDGNAGENDEDAAPRYTAILRTSPQSWVVENPAEVGPWIQGAPASADLGRRDVAVLLEGRFESYFDEPVAVEIPTLDDAGSEGDESTTTGVDTTTSAMDNATRATELRTDRHVTESVEDGRVLVVSSSALTTAQMLDAQNRTPNGTFLLNAVDYLNGAPGMARLRSKGLGVPRITVNNPNSLIVARWGNTILLPAIVIVIGLVVWHRRRVRSRRIRSLFSEQREEEV